MVIISNNQRKNSELSEAKKQEMEEIVWQMIEEEGGVKKVFQGMQAFKRLHRQFCEETPRLARIYNNQWVAYHDGRVVASADTHEAVLAEVDEQGISRQEMLTHYFTNEPQRWIL